MISLLNLLKGRDLVFFDGREEQSIVKVAVHALNVIVVNVCEDFVDCIHM